MTALRVWAKPLFRLHADAFGTASQTFGRLLEKAYEIAPR
jgi:hypothetical protein